MVLSMDDLRAVINDLRARDNDSRATLGCIGRGRSDLVLPGCAVLQGLTALWSVPSLSVADRGLREGMLLRMMQGKMPGRRRRPRSRNRNSSGQKNTGRRNIASGKDLTSPASEQGTD